MARQGGSTLRSANTQPIRTTGSAAVTLIEPHAAGSGRPVGAEVTADRRLRFARMGAHRDGPRPAVVPSAY
jgi:hypothetical protein